MQPMRMIGQVPHLKHAAADKSIDALCANLLTVHGGRSPLTLTVTSQRPGEGKTWMTTRLAQSLAAMNLKVLVVDLNAARPDAVRLLGGAGGPTLWQTLNESQSPAEAVQATAVESVDVVTGGFPRGIHTLLAGGRLPGLLAQWKTAYDVILVDTGSLDTSTEAVALLKLSDAGLMILGRRHAGMPRNLQVLAEVYGIDNLYFALNKPGHVRGTEKISTFRRRTGTATATAGQGMPILKRAALWFY
jgi:Mrp family chromosome partitioning ATPase